MITLSKLANSHRPKKKIQRVGRGPGSKRGKTSCRGNKGDKARCGYKQRYGEEGGQKPLYRKLPTRGFPNGRFRSETLAINFALINKIYEDGEVVSEQTLREKGYASKKLPGGIKILSHGELQKKVSIEAHAFSEGARNELEKRSIPFKVIEKTRSQ